MQGTIELYAEKSANENDKNVTSGRWTRGVADEVVQQRTARFRPLHLLWTLIESAYTGAGRCDHDTPAFVSHLLNGRSTS